MDFLTSLKISTSGLYAQRRRMDVIASNLSNIETTRTEQGGPYRRKMVVIGAKPVEDFESRYQMQIDEVQFGGVVEDQSPFKKAFNPSHPDADEDGYVLKPNIDLVVEMTNMLMARRAFEANLSAIKSTRQMALKALEIGR
jgi:flagellar basal-body rod protein FlgC